MAIDLSRRRPWFRMPSWLAELEHLDVMPLRELLKDSLYYPASACDGDPVRCMGGFIHSFVYAEYAMTKAEVMAGMLGEHHGFRGYRLAMCREVAQSELTPQGWRPTPLQANDGNPMAFQSQMPPPYALWAIFDRLPEFDDAHGPARFSLLHVCGDGVATFEALYNTHQIQPDVLAIIRSGTGYGLNWTDFRDPEQILARVALANKGGKPRYLLQEGNREYGGYWPGYGRWLEQWPSCSGNISLFECDNPEPEDEPATGMVDGDYVAEGSIRRRMYENYQRNRDEAR